MHEQQMCENGCAAGPRVRKYLVTEKSSGDTFYEFICDECRVLEEEAAQVFPERQDFTSIEVPE